MPFEGTDQRASLDVEHPREFIRSAGGQKTLVRGKIKRVDGIAVRILEGPDERAIVRVPEHDLAAAAGHAAAAGQQLAVRAESQGQHPVRDRAGIFFLADRPLQLPRALKIPGRHGFPVNGED